MAIARATNASAHDPKNRHAILLGITHPSIGDGHDPDGGVRSSRKAIDISSVTRISAMSRHPSGAACVLCDSVLVDQLAGRLAQQEPEAIANLSQDVVRKRIRAAVRRAMERGASSHAAILRFVLLMFALEPEFDQRHHVRQLLLASSGSFDDRILKMHEWSHPNCWYRAERSFTEGRWNHLTSFDEWHHAPVAAVSGPPAEGEVPSQLSRGYGFQLDVPYVETPKDVVLSMLRLAEVGPEDTVLDLGCGNGQIVITAATEFGAHGIGVDLDRARIETGRALAEQANVSDRVIFRRTDFFDTDFSAATVVTLYLLRNLNLALREKLQRELPNGARIVSWQFDMGDWQPNTKRSEHGGTIYCWHVNRLGA